MGPARSVAHTSQSVHHVPVCRSAALRQASASAGFEAAAVSLGVQLVNVQARSATDLEVATEMGLDVGAIQDLDRISRTPASLDALVGDDGGTTLGDLVDASDATPEDLVVEADSRGELIGLVDRLTDRESEVIRCRYGLVPGPKQTYEEIAGRIGVSRERVRQIEREALERLRLWVADTD